MAMKTTTSSGAGLRRSLRRRHKPQMLAPLKVRKPSTGGGLQLAALLAKRERRQAVREQRQREHRAEAEVEKTQDKETEPQPMLLERHLQQHQEQFTASPSSATSSPATTSPTEPASALSMILRRPSPAASATSTASTASSSSRPSSANTDGLHYIFGRYFDDNDRSAADILATLYYSGVLCTRKPVEAAAGCAPEVVERDHVGSPPLSPRFALPIDGDSVKVCDVALPSMQQTNIMLESWHSDSLKSASARTISTARVGADVEDDESKLHDSSRTASFSSSFSSSSSSSSTYPLTPGLSTGSTASARSSFSSTTITEAPEPFSASCAPRRWSTSPCGTSAGLSGLSDRPFASFEQSYFSSSPAPKQTYAHHTYASGQSHLHGMPSPPQSPTDIGRLSEYCWKPQSTQSTQTPTRPEAHAHHSQLSQFHFQYPTQSSQTLPRPYFQASVSPGPVSSAPAGQTAAVAPSALSAPSAVPRPLDSIATTIVTLPPAGTLAARAGAGASVPPLTPVTPIGLHSSIGLGGLGGLASGRSPMGPMTSPSSADAAVSRKRKYSSPASPPSSSSPASASASSATTSPPAPAPTHHHHVPRPHCNVKYETAELDFIMYQRCTKNRAWDDVTASFNAALPRLRQYAEMDGTLGSLDGGCGAGASGSVNGSLHGSANSSGSAIGGNKGVDRYRPRPERTTPGLQASYYRQRLALPLLDEAGRLVFDDQTNKQMFTEVMVRDDKSRKRRRLNGAAAGASSTTTTSTKSDDARVHLVLYFPERVAHYDYWFVTAEDKALAQQRAYERNHQRAQRGLPPWQPGSDDPETGILIRNKD